MRLRNPLTVVGQVEDLVPLGCQIDEGQQQHTDGALAGHQQVKVIDGTLAERLFQRQQRACEVPAAVQVVVAVSRRVGEQQETGLGGKRAVCFERHRPELRIRARHWRPIPLQLSALSSSRVAGAARDARVAQGKLSRGLAGAEAARGSVVDERSVLQSAPSVRVEAMCGLQGGQRGSVGCRCNRVVAEARKYLAEALNDKTVVVDQSIPHRIMNDVCH
mmetsp:Transcript_18057/g.57757  ORF Transcript_18057/g.57757 Transcript_18057/m.57757 type:complete len:219 (+) Transcript_18057:952-1608(+)